MKTTLQALFGLLFLLATSLTQAQDRTNCYRLTTERIPAIIDSIHTNFDTYPLISDQEIEHFLRQQLSQYPVDVEEVKAPNPNIAGFSWNTIQFDWPHTNNPLLDFYRVSVLNLEITLDPLHLSPTPENFISVGIRPFLFANLQLFAFTSVSGGRQSQLHIIIIDKDATLRCESGGFEPKGNSQGGSSGGGGRYANSSHDTAPPSVQLSPNPTDGAPVFCQLELPRAGTVAVQLYDLTSGRPLQDLMPPQELPAGSHRIPLLTSDLTPGHYACILTYEGRQYPQRLVVVRP
ncbi:MAG: hypothetical protein AAFW73_25490 [Bacteroidota bacterium]